MTNGGEPLQVRPRLVADRQSEPSVPRRTPGKLPIRPPFQLAFCRVDRSGDSSSEFGLRSTSVWPQTKHFPVYRIVIRIPRDREASSVITLSTQLVFGLKRAGVRFELVVHRAPPLRIKHSVELCRSWPGRIHTEESLFPNSWKSGEMPVKRPLLNAGIAEHPFIPVRIVLVGRPVNRRILEIFARWRRVLPMGRTFGPHSSLVVRRFAN